MSLHAGDIDRAWGELGMEIRDTKDRHARFYFEGRLILTNPRARRAWAAPKRSVAPEGQKSGDVEVDRDEAAVHRVDPEPQRFQGNGPQKNGPLGWAKEDRCRRPPPLVFDDELA